jgi:FkbM family methyltransferase
MTSYSQFGQDRHVLDTIYKGLRGGYFVEVGAYDGVTDSNSFLLETQNDWKGIVVECNPEWRASILKKRNCVFFPYAVYKKDDEVLPFYNSRNGLSGLVETNHHDEILPYATTVEVQTKRLNTLLSSANAPNFIEFLSLDTEGSEYEILKTVDFGTYTFGYICVEHNMIEEPRQKIRALLEANGYVFYRQNKVDDDYIHPSILERLRK